MLALYAVGVLVAGVYFLVTEPFHPFYIVFALCWPWTLLAAALIWLLERFRTL